MARKFSRTYQKNRNLVRGSVVEFYHSMRERALTSMKTNQVRQIFDIYSASCIQFFDDSSRIDIGLLFNSMKQIVKSSPIFKGIKKETDKDRFLHKMIADKILDESVYFFGPGLCGIINLVQGHHIILERSNSNKNTLDYSLENVKGKQLDQLDLSKALILFMNCATTINSHDTAKPLLNSLNDFSDGLKEIILEYILGKKT